MLFKTFVKLVHISCSCWRIEIGYVTSKEKAKAEG